MTLSTRSPTVRRRQLGLRLKYHREQSGLAVDDVAAVMTTSPRTVQRWEAGQGRIRPRDLGALLALYQVGAEESSELEALAREGSLRSWWTPYTGSVRPTFATFLGLEQDATSLMQWSTMVIPGRLQTEDYMRAIMRAARPRLDDETVEKRIQLRLKRQTEISAPCHFVLDESCLHRWIGGPSVMIEQLDHLRALGDDRRMTLQVIAYEAGVYADLHTGFSVLTFDNMPPVAHIETNGGDLYANVIDSERYAHHFSELREQALPEPMSLMLARKIRREFEDAR